MSAAWKALAKIKLLENCPWLKHVSWAGNRLYADPRKGTKMYIKQRLVQEMVIIFIPYVYYRMTKAQLGLMELSNIYSDPATRPCHPQKVA